MSKENFFPKEFIVKKLLQINNNRYGYKEDI